MRKTEGRISQLSAKIGTIFHSLLQMESGSYFDAVSEGVTEMHRFIHELHVRCSFLKML